MVFLATLVGTNMVVAFGFTGEDKKKESIHRPMGMPGVSTALTVMSDIEVLDIITWSWTSTYTPSPSYALDDGQNNGFGQGKTTAILPSTPSMAIVGGAVTGGLAMFVLIIVALYVFNYHQKKQRKKQRIQQHHYRHPSSDRNLQQHTPPHQSYMSGDTSDIRLYKDDDFWDEPDGKVHPQRPIVQIRTDLIRAPPMLPSPWSKQASFVRRAATTPVNHTKVSKPDEPSRSSALWVRRATTTAATISINTEPTIAGPSKSPSPKLSRPAQDQHSDEEEDGFDRQEFILRSDEMSSDGLDTVSVQNAIATKENMGEKVHDKERAVEMATDCL